MAIKLVVREAFGKYKRGDEITDVDAIESALVAHPNHVTKVEREKPATKKAQKAEE